MDILLLATVAIALLIIVLGAIRLMQLSLQKLLLAVTGAVVGLLMGGLLSIALGKLPPPYGEVLPLATSVLLAIAMIGVFLKQSPTLADLLPFLQPKDRASASTTPGGQILVDTSVIIDGRITDIAAAGFIRGKLLVPRFVLAELQNIADSDDPLRRGRGRRGLEMLHTIKGTSDVEFEVIDEDVSEIREVDAKLVKLAKRLDTDILTTDYNLNRVAQIEGVKVLNINELANAIRPVVLPGEKMDVKIVQGGKEKNQGVGYLPDGTMIVVEGGDKLIGQEVSVEVTRVFQTVAGKMIFAVTSGARQENGKSRSRSRKSRSRSNQS